MLKFIKNIFKNNKLDLDNDGKIESYQEEIVGLFSQFKTMFTKLDEVDDKLQDIISEEEIAKEMELDRLENVRKSVEDKIKDSDNRIEKVNAQIDTNSKLKEKVKEFII